MPRTSSIATVPVGLELPPAPPLEWVMSPIAMRMMTAGTPVKEAPKHE